ncbi:class I SAM-dependent methyltransferase [Candidatus Daviesbacteria bacterium]|nr:class I SAM-dependent methyltransferase [Candidatus Daviesbacteria bacterium]
MITILVLTIIILIICLLGLSWFAGSDAPYIPSNRGKLKKILKLAGVKNGTIFYELGSGDGRVVTEAARLGACAHGVEQSWIRVLLSRWQAKKLKLKNTHFFHGDIFKREYFPADVVYIYLLTPAVLKLEKKLKKELNQGSKVITQTYHFKNWKPYKKLDNFWIYIV